MSVETPISGMGLEEAKRSLLLQLQEVRMFTDSLMFKNVTDMSQEEVNKIYHEAVTRYGNLNLTEDHVDELEEETEDERP